MKPIQNSLKASENLQAKYYQVFYTKDINKKKKIYTQAILACEEKKIKLFNMEGEIIISANQKNMTNLDIDQEYIINHNYLSTFQIRIFIVVVDKVVPKDMFSTGKIFISNHQIVHLNTALQTNGKNWKNAQNWKGGNGGDNKGDKGNKYNKGDKNKSQKQLNSKNTPSIHSNLTETETIRFENGFKIQKWLYENLRPHQIEGVNFMYECLMQIKSKQIQGCILADFMGLGKTLQTITLIRCMIKMNLLNKIIVVTPLTLVKVWQKQCQKWMNGKLNPLICLGNSEEVSKILRMFISYQYRMLVLSYQTFYKALNQLNQIGCDLLIFDQGHRLKNKKSKLYQKIIQFKCKKRILLTGTPIQNNLDQLYTCISIVNPGIFGNEKIFKNVFQKVILGGMAKNAQLSQRLMAANRTLQLANRIKQFSLRRRANVLEQYLPIKRQFQIFFKLSNLQKCWYERCLKKKIKSSEVLSFLNQMRKLFTHPQIFKNDRVDHYQANQCYEDCRSEKSNKIQFIIEMALRCKEVSEKIIIVSYFTETLDFIKQKLLELNIKICMLDGRVDGKDRHKVIQMFKRQKTALLLSGKAGGTGLTLTCASKMILIQPDWNPSNDSQVMGRIWRQGQQAPVQIFRLIILSTFQEKILQRQQLKLALSQKLIDQQKKSQEYDFFSMKKLFLQIQQKCITYKHESNKINPTKHQFDYLSMWDEVFHVEVISSHENKENVTENQFQNIGGYQDTVEEENKEIQEEEFYVEEDNDQRIISEENHFLDKEATKEVIKIKGKRPEKKLLLKNINEDLQEEKDDQDTISLKQQENQYILKEGKQLLKEGNSSQNVDEKKQKQIVKIYKSQNQQSLNYESNTYLKKSINKKIEIDHQRKYLPLNLMKKFKKTTFEQRNDETKGNQAQN